MAECKDTSDLRNIQQEMWSLNKSLHEFRTSGCSENLGKMYDQIVDGSVINIGTSVDYRVPKMYQVKSVFGRLKCLAISRHLFSTNDIKAIEAKLRRKLDKFDTIYVGRPMKEGVQILVVIRLVKLRDIVRPKL